MSTPLPCRVRSDPPQAGLRNMQLDAELLAQAVAGEGTLRFYAWDEPTVSLGHFQAVQGAAVPERFMCLPVVTRLSGGGAILHHHELTYSIALPAWHPLSQSPSQLYDLVHECVIAELSERGISCAMRGAEAFADKSFLCFSRGDARDVVLAGHKILGSAQRRRQGAVLQHGSLLLRQSEFAPEFPGILELTGVDLDPAQLTAGLKARILDRLELEPGG